MNAIKQNNKHETLYNHNNKQTNSKSKANNNKNI